VPVPGPDARLVGRDAEIAALGEAVDRAWFAGQCPPFHGNLYGRGPEARRLAARLHRRRSGRVGAATSIRWWSGRRSSSLRRESR
jgi:hypothetical protein